MICVVWTLKTMKYYLKGCLHFDLWTDHNPSILAMNKNIRMLTERLEKF